MNYDELHAKLSAHGQEQLLKFWNELDDGGKAQLASQIAAIDFDRLDDLIADYVLKKPAPPLPSNYRPAPFYPLVPPDDATRDLYRRAVAAGECAIGDGKVACLTVAGGQGTRLGFDAPKGTYPIAPVSGKPLFAIFAESIAANQRKYGTGIDWYIMTSSLNHRATTEFFKKYNYFGLEPEQVFFFVQGTMPAIGYDGKILLSGKDSIALSPDGHGGTLWALKVSGALARMKERGTEYLSYFQVDNPLVPVVDPKFIGLHILDNARMSAISLAKTNPFEKLGNFCVADGRVWIIEYSDLPDALAEKRNPDGSLCFVAGSPAIHVISRDFVEELTGSGRPSLPWHRADKKVPYVDADGTVVKPEKPNAVKLESFIFDALPMAGKTVLMEADRADEFAPTKNATGVDSVESCRKMLSDQAKRRLAAAGVDVSGAGIVEISPLVGTTAEEVASYAQRRNLTAVEGERVYIAG